MPSSSDLNNLDDKLSKLQREIESIRTESEEQYDELITAIERLSDRQPPSTGLDAVMFESLDDWKSRIDAYKQQKEDFKNKPDE